LKKARTDRADVERAERYLRLPGTHPRDLAAEFLLGGASLDLAATDPALREKAQREAAELCLEYRAFMGWDR
jgi:hypothetical protein